MNRRWVFRLGLPLVTAGVIAAVAIGTGRELNVGYLLAAALVLSTVGWLASDLLPRVSYPSWTISAAYTPRQPGTDLRLERFTDRLTSGVDRDAVAHDVHRVLSEVIDERLRRVHGIDRMGDPEAAALVLGPELNAYLVERPHLNRTGQAQKLSALLTRIEAL